MKRIHACIKNKEHLAKVTAFCEEEHYTLTTSEAPSFTENDMPVFFITDGHFTIADLGHSSVPLCVISDSKPERGVFHLRENFSVYHLRMLVDYFYHGNVINNYPATIVPTSIVKEFVLENDYNNIDKAVCAMTGEFSLFFKFSDLEKIRVGMSEIITNAMEHGNLAITGEEKMLSTESGTYYDLLEERLNNPEYSNRKTYVSIKCSEDTLYITIKDSGDGFDTSKIPDPTDTEHLMLLHGRGIFIARMYFNEIKYNDKGNEVTLIKKMKK